MKDEKKQLFEFMVNFDNDDMPDGAWQCMLEDAVDHYNEDQNTEFDSYVMFMQYLAWKAERSERSL